jgi:hypothetical protein
MQVADAGRRGQQRILRCVRRGRSLVLRGNFVMQRPIGGQGRLNRHVRIGGVMMKFRIVRFLGLIVTLSAITTVAVRYIDARMRGGTVRAQEAPRQYTLLSQPSSWVAFEADLTISKVEGKSIKGKFFRASDGSMRLETGATVIHNIPRSLYYQKTRMGPWESFPMTLPPEGWVPDRYFAGRAGVGLQPLTEKVSGFEVYQQRNDRSGTIWLRAPALNFFDLVKTNSRTGARWSYSNVRLVEPNVALFLPPADDVVLIRTEPNGIVTTQGPAAEQAEKP